MRKIGLAGLGLALALAGGAGAAEKKPPPSGWVTMPEKEDRAAAFGPIVKRGTFYRAVARCAVNDDGSLKDCRLIRDTPNGAGFGAALLSLAPKFKRKPPGAKDLREVSIADSWSAFDKAPDWVRRPTPEQLLAVFPTEAYKRGQEGKATINCIVTTQGALADCVTLEETPAGAGFGGAAIALTPQFLLRPATSQGAPVQSTANLPITFKTFGPAPTAGSKKVINAAIAWSEAPTFAQVAAAYPAKARAQKRGGRATIACNMTEQGRLSRCQVATSDPKGYGFDTAAKELSKYFAIPVTSDADRKATRDIAVHLPITFDPAMLDQAVIGKPIWAAVPKGDQLTAAFRDVKASGTSRAMLNCAVQAGGRIDDCRVASETPPGAGVGAAALQLAPTFRLATWSDEGLPIVGGRVNIPIRYEGERTAEKP